MRKPNVSSPQLSPREREVKALFEQGLSPGQIAEKMGLKGAGSASAYLSMLRRKGAIPLLTEGIRGRRIKEVGPPPSRDAQFRPLEEEEGLALQQVKQAALAHAPADVEVTVRRRRKSVPEGISMTTYTLAKMLDEEIHEFVRRGGHMDNIHRAAVRLIGVLLGS